MLKWFKRFKRSEKGQGMVEYGLILALVSIVALGALGGIGDKVNGTFDKVVGVVSGGETVVPADFIPVATAEELAYLNESKEQTFGKGTKWEGEYTSGLDKNYILVSNLDLSGIEFEPLGTLNNGFEGIFDGGGYVISNLTVDKGSYNRAGLFGYAEGASFKNIGLEEVNVKGASFSGGLVGYQDNSSITDSYATGNVTGDSYVGGLVGYQDNSSITDSYATGNVTGTGDRVGGLVGYEGNSSTITSSYATGTVTGNYWVGGLVGLQNSSSTVTSSYATGTVTGGSSHVGGLVGYQSSSSTVTSSYYDTQTTKQETSDGGTGKTTAEMKKKDTYVDWDFESVWKIESNQYPTHR